MHFILWVIFPIILIPCVLMGILGDIKHGDLGHKLNRAPWDKHPITRQQQSDGSFVDGMITGVALDELDHMFKGK